MSEEDRYGWVSGARIVRAGAHVQWRLLLLPRGVQCRRTHTCGGPLQRHLELVAAAQALASAIVTSLKLASWAGVWVRNAPPKLHLAAGDSKAAWQAVEAGNSGGSWQQAGSCSRRPHLNHKLRPLPSHRLCDARPRHPAVLRVSCRLHPAVVLPLPCIPGSEGHQQPLWQRAHSTHHTEQPSEPGDSGSQKRTPELASVSKLADALAVPPVSPPLPCSVGRHGGYLCGLPARCHAAQIQQRQQKSGCSNPK